MNVVQETQERQFVSLFQPYMIEHLDYLAIADLASDVALPRPVHAASIHDVVGEREFRNWVFMRLEWADDLRDQHVWVRERVDGILQILDCRTP